jgi:hypothetical protein
MFGFEAGHCLVAATVGWGLGKTPFSEWPTVKESNPAVLELYFESFGV